MTYRVLNGLFLLAYALSVLVQFNDPDPWQWVALYGAAALMCLLWYRNALPRWLPLCLLIISLVWIGTLLPALRDVSVADIFDSLGMKTRAVEEAREIGGLALVAVWSGVLARRER